MILFAQFCSLPRIETRVHFEALDAIHLGVSSNGSLLNWTHSGGIADLRGSNFYVSYRYISDKLTPQHTLSIQGKYLFETSFIPRSCQMETITIRRISPKPNELRPKIPKVKLEPLHRIFEEKYKQEISGHGNYNSDVQFIIPMEQLDEGIYEIDLIGEICDEKNCLPITSRFLFGVYTDKKWWVPIYRFWDGAMSI